ncbi:MAG: uncharacterized protein A8A55_0871 [Amphiamblys sp. WSBS2006]|nr:MAG: uncharacterized protein A8A55_0871 [Amphiamblys sp. WSBS2006]
MGMDKLANSFLVSQDWTVYQDAGSVVVFPSETRYYSIKKRSSGFFAVEKRHPGNEAARNAAHAFSYVETLFCEQKDGFDLLKAIVSLLEEEKLLESSKEGVERLLSELVEKKEVFVVEKETEKKFYRLEEKTVVVFKNVVVAENFFDSVVGSRAFKTEGQFAVICKAGGEFGFEDSSFYERHSKYGEKTCLFDDSSEKEILIVLKGRGTKILQKRMDREVEHMPKTVFVFAREKTDTAWLQEDARLFFLGNVKKLSVYNYGVNVLGRIEFAKGGLLSYLEIAATKREEIEEVISVEGKEICLGETRGIRTIDYGICVMKKIRLPKRKTLETFEAVLIKKENTDDICGIIGDGVDLGTVKKEGVMCSNKELLCLLKYRKEYSFLSRVKEVWEYLKDELACLVEVRDPVCFGNGQDTEGEGSDWEDTGREDSTGEDTGREDTDWEDSTGEDIDWEDTGREDSAREDSAREDSAKEDSAKEDSAREDSAREDSAREDTAREDTGGENKTEREPASKKKKRFFSRPGFYDLLWCLE